MLSARRLQNSVPTETKTGASYGPRSPRSVSVLVFLGVLGPTNCQEVVWARIAVCWSPPPGVVIKSSLMLSMIGPSSAEKTLLYASSHPGLRECPSVLHCNPSTSFTAALLYRIVLQFALLQRAVWTGLRPALLCCVVIFYRSANFLSFLNVKIVKRKEKRQGWGVMTPQPIIHCVDKMQSKWV